MNPAGRIKLVSQLLDLPIIDSEGEYCGIVDDLELAGSAGKSLKIRALLVGPGAYAGRLPNWTMPLVRIAAGDGLTRVPFGKVRTIASAVQLECPASELGLGKSDAGVARWLPRKGAL